MISQVRRVVVTGSEGLIGGAAIRALQAHGIDASGVDLATGTDVAGDGIGDVLSAAAPDVVVHAAAHPGGASLHQSVDNVRVNALGSMRIFDWCAQSRVPVIFLSSSIVYGSQEVEPIPETAHLQPGTVYGVAKAACEGWLRVLGEGRNLEWTVLRLFATYGGGHKRSSVQGIVNVMLTQLEQGNRVEVRGSLGRRRDLVYVDDVAAAIVAAVVTPGARGQILNIGTGQAVTIGQMITRLASALGRNPDELELIELPGTVGDPPTNVADITRARTVLGYRPAWSLDAGLEALARQRTAAV